MKKKYSPANIAFVSTFPPKECGLAAFTYDLTKNFNSLLMPELGAKIIAVDSKKRPLNTFNQNVIFSINKNQAMDYAAAAKMLNAKRAITLVNIQHEYGIFGGIHGKLLQLLVNELRKPIVITMHTVLPEPEEEIFVLTKELINKASAVTVMTKLSKEILINRYNVPDDKIYIIPHGIHALEFENTEKSKKKLGLDGFKIATTFGLLSRGKGIEYVLEALPETIKTIPNIKYLIIGKTHPEILKTEGEAYRNFLIQKVKSLNLEEYVLFYNKYQPLQKLLKFLRATDVYISPSLDPNQAVSGTMSYALGTGRPVISTAFAQAKADISPEVGRLVGFKNPGDYTYALIEILSSDILREQMSKNAYFRTRHMTWQNTALSYLKIFSKFAPTITERNLHLPKINLQHFLKLTDNFGMFQFAELNDSNPAHGYTLDDNARALAAVSLLYKQAKNPQAIKLAKVYLGFIGYSQQTEGNFLNFFNKDQILDHKVNQETNQEEANARAIFALMLTKYFCKLPLSLDKKAGAILEKASIYPFVWNHPRAKAYLIKGLYFKYLAEKKDEDKEKINMFCQELVSLYRDHASKEWEWFEKHLTYSNSLLSEAMLYGFLATGNSQYYQIGKDSLDFLISQTFINDLYMPIGQNGWYSSQGKRSYFDQQPEDAASMVQTLKVMYKISKEEHYNTLLHKSFQWFLGENILGQFIYDSLSGGCYDGLGEKYINLNQGAESTISYLLARLAMEPD